MVSSDSIIFFNIFTINSKRKIDKKKNPKKQLFTKCGAGKMITPERSSAEYLSVLGHLDTRVDLDKTIHHKDAKYKALLSIMASKFSYENEQFISNAVTNHWGVSYT
jgi:hypothetical protein